MNFVICQELFELVVVLLMFLNVSYFGEKLIKSGALNFFDCASLPKS